MKPFYLLLFTFPLCFFSCISINDISYSSNIDNVAVSQSNDLDISGNYFNSPQKWSRGETVADVGQDFSSVIWFLFPPDTTFRGIHSFSIIQEVNTITIKLFDEIGTTISDTKYSLNKDYFITENGIVFKRKKNWFIFNQLAGTGVSTDILFLTKDTNGNLIVKKQYIYNGVLFIILPAHNDEHQWLQYRILE